MIGRNIWIKEWQWTLFIWTSWKLSIKFHAIIFFINYRVLEYTIRLYFGYKTSWTTSQAVLYNNCISSSAEVRSGVPQGTVVGPSSFLTFVKYLPNEVSSMIYMFADDTKLYKGISENADRQQLPSDIDNLVTWSTKWKLLFGLNKCKVMTLGHPPDVSDYTMTQNNGKHISVQRSHPERDFLRTYTYGFQKSKWNYGSRQKNFYMSWLWVFQFAVQVIGQNISWIWRYNLVPAQNEGHWNYSRNRLNISGIWVTLNDSRG